MMPDDPEVRADQEPRFSRPQTALGCLLALGMVIGAGAVGYVVGFWLGDTDSVDGFQPVYSAMVGTVAGVVLGAIAAALLVFRQR